MVKKAQEAAASVAVLLEQPGNWWFFLIFYSSFILKTALPFFLTSYRATSAHVAIIKYYSAFIAQRILVDLARPFWAHSCADGRTTSLA